MRNHVEGLFSPGDFRGFAIKTTRLIIIFLSKILEDCYIFKKILVFCLIKIVIRQNYHSNVVRVNNEQSNRIP